MGLTCKDGGMVGAVAASAEGAVWTLDHPHLEEARHRISIRRESSRPKGRGCCPLGAEDQWMGVDG